MEIRPASGAGDLAICVEMFVRTSNDLGARHGDEPFTREDVGWMPASLDHLASTDPGDLVLALDGGDPVGFGCAFRRERFWFLSYLYVVPERQGAGLGRRILRHLLRPPPERGGAILATVAESRQPVSTMLYASIGIAPRVPLYWLEGEPRLDQLPGLPDGVSAQALSLERHGEQLDRLDRKLLGYARAVDHAMWIREAPAARAYLASDGTMAGYGYRAPDDWICPLGAIDEELAAAIVRDLASPGTADGTKVTVQVAGSAGALLPLLLRAGLRSEEGATLLYCSNGRVPAPSYLPYGGFLP